jgi:hypothetical protein
VPSNARPHTTGIQKVNIVRNQSVNLNSSIVSTGMDLSVQMKQINGKIDELVGGGGSELKQAIGEILKSAEGPSSSKSHQAQRGSIHSRGSNRKSVLTKLTRSLSHSQRM